MHRFDLLFVSYCMWRAASTSGFQTPSSSDLPSVLFGCQVFLHPSLCLFLSHSLSHSLKSLPSSQKHCKFPSLMPLIPGIAGDGAALHTAEDRALRSRSLDQYSSIRAKNARLTSCHFSSLSDSISNAAFIQPNASSSWDNVAECSS